MIVNASHDLIDAYTGEVVVEKGEPVQKAWIDAMFWFQVVAEISRKVHGTSYQLPDDVIDRAHSGIRAMKAMDNADLYSPHGLSELRNAEIDMNTCADRIKIYFCTNKVRI
jgi:hypothetical protein